MDLLNRVWSGTVAIANDLYHEVGEVIGRGTDCPADPGILVSNGPTWMSRHAKRSIYDLALPGSHDSAAYMFDSTTPFVVPYSKTQQWTMLHQLMNGVRALDLRVMTYRGKIWLSHKYLIIPLVDGLQQIVQFVSNHPTEIVTVLLAAEYEHRESMDYRKCEDILINTLRDYLVQYKQYTEGSRLSDLLKDGNIILLAREDQFNTQKKLKLWPVPRSRWNNSPDPKVIAQRIREQVSENERDNKRFIEACATCTPNANSIMADPLGSVQKLAQSLEPSLREFVKSERAAYNILWMDYVKPDIVAAVIARNESDIWAS
eukprot:Colp12_sorted_trinity150504_noHs@2436